MAIDRIIPQLFLGDIEGAQNLKGLKEKGITHILQAMGGMDPIFPKDFKYKVLEVMDTPSENLGRYFDEVVRWIQGVINQGGCVFVHW